MNTHPRAPAHSPLAAARLAVVRAWRGALSLDDPQRGRPPDAAAEERPAAARPQPPRPNGDEPPQTEHGPRRPRPAQGASDLDELWNEMASKLERLFGDGRGGKGKQPPPNGRGAGEFRFSAAALALLGAAALVLWLLSGFFFVQEGYQSVITRFGSYHHTVGAGIHWRAPWPVQWHETVNVTQIRSVDIGTDAVIKSTGLRDSAMLTADENIVEIKFAVQYRLSNARDFLFASRDPTQAVVQAAETAVREVIGNMKMDAALAEERDQIAPRVRKLMQDILDRYKIGVDVVGVNLQQGGVRPPEQVQAAFDDVLKAVQEAERAQNEAQAYANRIVPLATGTVSRLKAESEGYKARVVAQALGDASRFAAILPEYQKAPQATRDRMYIDTMRDIYSSTNKIVLDARQGSMLYLPLDKILQHNASAAQSSSGTAENPSSPAAGNNATPAAAAPTAPSTVPPSGAAAVEAARSRDPAFQRSRF